MTDEQKKAAVAMFGEEFANQLIVQGEQKTKELEEAGVASKAVSPEGQPVPEKPEGTKEPVESPVTPPTEDQSAAAATGEPAQEAAPAADPNQVLQALAAEMVKGFNETLIPILDEIKQGQASLTERVKQLESDQATKQKIEMPRFTLDVIRASQSQNTVVTEGDALKNQKPQEVQAAVKEGSVAAAFFPSPK